MNWQSQLINLGYLLVIVLAGHLKVLSSDAVYALAGFVLGGAAGAAVPPPPAPPSSGGGAGNAMAKIGAAVGGSALGLLVMAVARAATTKVSQ
jgi:hypothetical protein